MPQLIVAGLILWCLVYGLKYVAKAKPAHLVKAVRQGGGGVAVVLGCFLALRGQIELGLGLAAVGAWAWGFADQPHWHDVVSHLSPVGAQVMTLFGLLKPRHVSRMRSAMIEMQVDVRTGAMQGTVLAGPGEGRALASLTQAEFEALLAQCRTSDPEGLQLLEIYLDRRFAGWRQAGDGDRNAGGGPVSRSGAMSLDEAYETLGLQAGASREEIAVAHRALIKKLHPDHGGSTSLAARVNQAKDVLMRRHD